MKGIQRNHLSGISLILAISLSLPPFRAFIINDMMIQMDVQIPLLTLTGILLKVPNKLIFDKLNRLNLYGLSSFIFTQVVLAYWMLPISIDRAVIFWQYDVAKNFSLILCGINIRVAFTKSTLVMQLFFLGYFLSMMTWIGEFYLQSNERLCNVYTQNSQQNAGLGLIFIAATVFFIWMYSNIKNRSLY